VVEKGERCLAMRTWLYLYKSCVAASQELELQRTLFGETNNKTTILLHSVKDIRDYFHATTHRSKADRHIACINIGPSKQRQLSC
jgi:hypothetical protein